MTAIRIEIGHIGSYTQACERLNHNADWNQGASQIMLECEITLENPIENLPDIDDWDDHQSIVWAILQASDDPDLHTVAKRYQHMRYRFDLPREELPHMQLKCD